MQSTGGLTADVPESLNQIQEKLLSWALAARLNVSNISPGQVASFGADLHSDKPEAKFQRLEVTITGYANMAQLARFLWRVESEQRILKVLDMKIVPRKEATDDLQFTLKVGTISLIGDKAPGQDRSRPMPSRAGGGVQP